MEFPDTAVQEKLDMRSLILEYSSHYVYSYCLQFYDENDVWQKR